MADGEEPESNSVQLSGPGDEVFVNGDTDGSKGNNLLHPEYNTMPDQVLPRRSSLVKDANRRQQRKKTVSFSSMPNERSVVNGKSTSRGFNTLS